MSVSKVGSIIPGSEAAGRLGARAFPGFSIRHGEDLSADDWGRIFGEAAALGVVHVGLTGGEPSARRDLEAIVEAAIAADLYPHLVTAGLPLTPERLAGLEAAPVAVEGGGPCFFRATCSPDGASAGIRFNPPW